MSLSRLENLEERLARRKRVHSIQRVRLRDRDNPLEFFDSHDFKLRFHMFKHTALYIASLIENDLSGPIKRGIYIPPIMQFLTVLRYYTTGSFQLVISDLHQVTQPTVCRLIRRVSVAIAKLRANYIKFPKINQAAIERENFYEIAKFPGVTGVIDGCHIKIQSPGGEDAELFRNRKSDFSVNVQGVCDSNLNFIDVVARWYGSAHDTRIFENSLLYAKLECGDAPGMLLGDSGYPLLPFLMKPLKNPVTRAEKRYQRVILTTRNLIERCFGVWKRRFPCLHKMRLKLQTTLTVIVSTAILHNISRNRFDIYDDDIYESLDCDESVEDSPVSTSSASSSAKAVQKNIITSHFEY